MIGPEMGAVLAGAPDLPSAEPTEDYAQLVVLEFLSEIDPVALEQLALARVGGLTGESSIGQCFLDSLKELAGGA